jgi:hypothetical protein
LPFRFLRYIRKIYQFVFTPIEPNNYKPTVSSYHTIMKPQKKVLVLKAPLTWILIDEDRDSERAKEEWLLNRENRLNGSVDKKGK